ncbi:NADH-quinone oxidoreductase subunit D [Chloroflexi bacterium TSY]|nr:NADH-quinone oxidoreductase subunit D [Chloroflexi bacterium TSY]
MSDAVAEAPVAEEPTVDGQEIDSSLPYNDAVPGAVLGQWAEETDPGLIVAPDKLISLLMHLRDTEKYDLLSSLTCVDYESYGGKQRAGVSERFDTVYHLFSTSKGGGHLKLHVRVPENETVPSATSVYPGANLQEREVYDLFGIKFDGHPNLRRILLWEGFHGHPMRKDWKEAYHESDAKPFKSRHPAKGYEWHEDKLPWGKNTAYPAEWDPEDWKEPVTYVPVSQALGNEEYGALDTESIVVNLGPHHPSTHGVFRMLARIEGETILALEPEMGYLHRNHEKIGERNTWLMNMPYTDRLDYINSMSNNLGLALAVEKLLNIDVPERANYIRIIMAEFTRIVNHLWSIGFILNDLGALQTPALYAIEEREMILDLFEEVSGARLMCNYMRFGGVVRDLTPDWVKRATYLAHDRLPRALDELDELLSGNEIVKARGRGVGYLSAEDLISLSVSGPMIRAAGVPYDIRRAEPYCIYDRFEFDIPTLPNGDIYDRYYIRLLEARESVKILRQALRDIPGGDVQGAPAYASATLEQGFGEIIGGRGGYTFRPPEGEVYQRIEGPKGELGYFLVSDNKANPFRYHVRSPSYINLNALGPMSVGYKVADAIVILGAIDIVLGEVDR